MSVEKTAGCVLSFVRTLLVDIGVGVPPDLEEMGKIVEVRKIISGFLINFITMNDLASVFSTPS